MSQYPEAYLEGIRLFNERQFFECHDVLEELWDETLGDEKQFYQGLIHAAVALFHFETGNLGGARKMYDSTRRYLLPYTPRYAGIDLDRFLDDFRHCFRELLESGPEYPFHVKLRDDRIPVLHFSAEPQSD